MNPGINLITPLIYDKSDGPYKTTKTMGDAIRQNLKVLFMTSPGERIMIQDFGIGIRRYLFENISTSLVSNIKERIATQISRFMPYIKINKLQVDFGQDSRNTLSISLGFSVSGVINYSVFELSVSEPN